MLTIAKDLPNSAYIVAALTTMTRAKNGRNLDGIDAKHIGNMPYITIDTETAKTYKYVPTSEAFRAAINANSQMNKKKSEKATLCVPL
ncbi:hypothetical protein BBBOND_0301310 [Babesia bigemina]|uniref:Uncharacterized protein n=1 Tax=Babesia bigemina TaxID=5866 RepID=A0A061D8C2_BABBI|nr:hypothetical protein BBBOND_0301310 [Babesia bigemina]CDR96227.1 hypothetical protein BBBOND_0301310 [Babesia bigemina]|eukprot:XP_012768413.1 hypothetical protein BBBOND_0301310 [Babesia bigemina]